MRRLFKLLGPALFIVILFTVVDLSRLAEIGKSLRLQMVVLAVLLFFPLMLTQTLRWWLVCRQLRIFVTFSALFEIYYISWFLGSLPLSGASAASKALYLKSEGIALDRSAASVVIDKVLDLFGIMGFALFGLMFLPHRYLENLLSGWLYIAVGTIFFLAALKTPLVKKAWDRALRFFVRRFGQIAPNLASVVSDFRQDTGTGTIIAHLLLILGIGLLRGMILYVLALSLGLNVSFLLMVACRSLVGIVNIVPVSISGLGTRDAVLLLILPLWGITSEAAVALGFLAFLWTVFTKLTGVVFWIKRYH
ncbi:MAG: flippase-like domain-containing protein [Desulfobacterales bacterium]|nr:flippase-like domain-containing protein [Desulfobacterales bacterium]